MKAVIYARVSSIGDRQSTTRQVADLMKYAQYKEYEVVRIFEEHGSGGKKNQNRPILLEAVSFCINMNIDTILVSELSRIGRNAFEVLDTINILKENNINIFLQKENFTLLDENGKPSIFAPILLATLATCAELERENIAHRLNSGYNQYRANGGKVENMKAYTEMTMDEIREIVNRGGDQKRKLDIAVQEHIESMIDQLSDKARDIFLNTDCNGLAEVFGGIFTAEEFNEFIEDNF